ncbi:hypothetical protein Dehly_1261 [Dehalogenimonas lykanthroporepellens BL-DC-9]|nr:hypothetical protein Dehly_1261 [Dehalogenimonas lykanthroporepellens BL-DC-9]
MVEQEEFEGCLVSSYRDKQLLAKAGLRESDVEEWLSSNSSDSSMSSVKRYDYPKDSYSALLSVFLSYGFKHFKGTDDYEKAIMYFSYAIALRVGSDICLGEVIKQQEAVDVMEYILAPGFSVSSWEIVADACALIHDNLESISDTEDIDRDLEVTDSQGKTQFASDYWQKAKTLAETKMAPEQLRDYLNLKENDWHKTRLFTDFFKEYMNLFSTEGLQNLIAMEINWYSNEAQGATKGGAISSLDKCMRHELEYLVFKPIQPHIDAIFRNKDLVVSLSLSAKDKPQHLGLRNMSLILSAVGNQDIRDTRLIPPFEAIIKLGFKKASLGFIFNELPEFLKKLSDCRNEQQHGSLDKNTIKVFEVLRDQALGIGAPGILKRMLIAKSEKKQGPES